MARKAPNRSGVVKRLYVPVAVLCVVAAAVWTATDGFGYFPLPFLTPFVVAVLAIAFWALGEQFLFSFGKSRYLTRTEKKRLKHQRKKKKGDDAAKVLGRKIPHKLQP
jgi:hypothetical protein